MENQKIPGAELARVLFTIFMSSYWERMYNKLIQLKKQANPMKKEMKNSIWSTLKKDETLEMATHMLLIKPRMLERIRTIFQKLKI